MWEREEAGKSCLVVIIHNLTHDKFCEVFDVSFRFGVITATFLQILVFGTYTATALTMAASVFGQNSHKQKTTSSHSTKCLCLPLGISQTVSAVSVHTGPCGAANKWKVYCMCYTVHG